MLENLDTRGGPPSHLPPQPHVVGGPPTMRPPKMNEGPPQGWRPHPHQQIVSDDMRFQIIDAVYLRPGIWDIHRDKNGPSRKALFAEITQLLNQQLQESLTCEEVEKQWKNLKDTYNKTKKKMTFDNEGNIIAPKWKFYTSMVFLEDVASAAHQNGATRMHMARGKSEDSENGLSGRKRHREPDEEEEDDEYMGFCRSLVYSLRDIGDKDRLKWIQLQKSIRDQIYECQVEIVAHHQQQQQQQQHHMLR